MQLQQIFHNVRWFGFDDYQNCFPIFVGSFAFPEACNLSGYLVKIWVDATRDKPTNFKALGIDPDDWAYRYYARFVIERDGKQITDQRDIDNMLSVGDIINSAYRWMANNRLNADPKRPGVVSLGGRRKKDLTRPAACATLTPASNTRPVSAGFDRCV